MMRNLKAKALKTTARAVMAACTALLLQTMPTQTLNANGDNRSIKLYHSHSKESINITYMSSGEYDSAALKKLNWFLRDWRSDEPTNMDPRLFDIVWHVQREMRTSEPFVVVSAYRSPATNAMLRKRSRGVAKHSQHMRGKAMDFYVPGGSMAKVREIGLRLQRGGVGYYPSANNPFVHLDSGSVRHWPKMPRYQLARIFPDGKTVHIPSDGRPMERYDEALAEVERYGGTTAASYAQYKKGSKSFWAKLFSASDDDEDDGEEIAIKPSRNAPKTTAPRTAVASLDTEEYDLEQSSKPINRITSRPQVVQNNIARDIITPSATELRNPAPSTTPAPVLANVPAPEVSPRQQVASLPTLANTPSPTTKPFETTQTPQVPSLVWQRGPEGIKANQPYKIANVPVPISSPRFVASAQTKTQVASLGTIEKTPVVKVANIPVPMAAPLRKVTTAQAKPTSNINVASLQTQPEPKPFKAGKGDKQNTEGTTTASIPSQYNPKSATNLINEAHSLGTLTIKQNDQAAQALLKAGTRLGTQNGFETATQVQPKKFQ